MMVPMFSLATYTIYFHETKGRFFYLRGRKEDMVWADTEAELRKESHIKAPVVSIEGFSK